MPESPPSAHPLGERWLREVDSLVEFARGRKVSRFNIDEVARRGEVTLEIRPLEPRLLGLTLDRERVLLNSTLGGSLAAFTFAHELGHIYRRRGYFPGLRRGEEEWFADWFAREMVFPRGWLKREWHVGHLAALHVDRVTAALQLAVMGKAPALMRVGDKVLCRTCGSRQHRSGCQCARFRTVPRSNQLLPELPHFRRSFPPRFQQLSILGKSTSINSSPGCAAGVCRTASDLSGAFQWTVGKGTLGGTQVFSQRAW